MKLPLLCFAFCLFSLSKEAAAHPACDYKSVRLKLTANEVDCQKECATFKNPKKGKCFAFVFNAGDETCDGYLFDHSNANTRFEACGSNPGIVVSSLDAADSNEQESASDDYYDAYYDANITGRRLQQSPADDDYDDYGGYQDEQKSPSDDDDGVYDVDDYQQSVFTAYYADLTEPDQNESDFDFSYSAYLTPYDDSPSNAGCTVIEENIGAASSRKQCKKLCTEVAVDGKIYGGCAAWFWSPSEEECKGLLFKRETNENICGSV